jgi:hypothetical protein
MGLETWTGLPSDLTKQLDADLKRYGDLTSRLKLSLD